MRKFAARVRLKQKNESGETALPTKEREEMKAKKILNQEIETNAVASLPTRPSAPSVFSRGLTAAELKAAFDRLPKIIIERFNALLDDLAAAPDESVAGEIKTGIREGHTLRALFSDIENGNLAAYLAVGDSSLAATLADIKVRLAALEGRGDENV